MIVTGLLNRNRLTKAADRLGALLPSPANASSRQAFMNLRPGFGGPGTFASKLEREFRQQSVSVTYRNLRSSTAALMFSVSWGDWFYRLCRRWSVRTVLRLDGFSIPEYHDNRQQPSGYQDRHFTINMMALNYRIQKDLALADFVIYQSEFSKECADRYLYKRRDDYAVIMNGVDLDHFTLGPPEQRKRRLLSMGNIRHEYMLGTVLPVFKGLWARHDLELLIVGSLDAINGEILDTFRRENPNLSDRIIVTGPVANDDLPSYIHKSDVLVHPRLGDACPNVIVEAMACGVPVVCGAWGGAAELVGEAGAVVSVGPWEYGDDYVESLTCATAVVLEDLEHYRSLARKRAESEFDIRQVAIRYIDHLFGQGNPGA
ncbi:MAG: glycosyltransferase family 4 protein [Chloroflexi bacterium]|nr:glycosyltransferase family 4 protein [Chloroflexota bacterium]